MTTVKDILNAIENLAPAYMKEKWDNVGLLCGSKNAPVTKILVALDPFEHVCREATDWGAELIVTHHPIIFQPLPNLTDDTSIGRGIMALCRHGISAINAHTNLDSCPMGVNYELASTLGLQDIEVTHPVGADSEGRPFGLLRSGNIDEMPLESFLELVKIRLGTPTLRYVDGGKPVRRVAVGGGSCAGAMMQAIDDGCDTFVTADIKYNQFWDAQDLGLNLIDAGHFYTENIICAVLAQVLRDACPDVAVKISETHTDCMKFY